MSHNQLKYCSLVLLETLILILLIEFVVNNTFINSVLLIAHGAFLNYMFNKLLS